MESRGGVTGGATINDFLTSFEEKGYTGSFLIHGGGNVECTSCGAEHPANSFPIHRLRRVEGVSDPADMCIVAALECGDCHARGTFTACVGAACPPEEAEVLRLLDHTMRSGREAALDESRQDSSLVGDTGWLDGPPNG